MIRIGDWPRFVESREIVLLLKLRIRAEEDLQQLCHGLEVPFDSKNV